MNRAFTILELVVIVAIVALLVAMLQPGFSHDRRKHAFITCRVNLKQIGIGSRMYANDNNGMLPSFADTNEAWQYFQAAGDWLSSPRVLLCPADKDRPQCGFPLEFNVPPGVNSFAAPEHRNNSLSYFYGAASSPGKSLLAGDRNIALKDQRSTGVITISSTAALSWTSALHDKKGNVVFGDGSVLDRIDASGLRKALSTATNETQRLIIP